MGLIDETTDGEKAFGVGHFDLIVIDEAHRSIYSKYGQIFSYFDSLLVGLTATPKDEVDRDTYRLFDLEKGVPTDTYSLDEAVSDGFLVPPRVVSVPLKFMRQGITYDQLPEDEKAEWDEIEWSESDPPPNRVDAGAVNTWLFNKDTVDKALEYLMTHGQKVAAGDRLGKTIIFAKNHDHAQFIVERFDVAYPHLKGSFARVIDVKTEYAQSLIDDFSIPEKSPHIAVSVDMLDTGIDIPDIVNLVFFKIVRSQTKFWQMLGRGTRLRPDLFGPGFPKEFFYVFDFCMNFEFFNQDPKIVDTPIADSLTKRLFTARVELVSDIHALSTPDTLTTDLCRDTAARLQKEVAAMTTDNFIVRPKREFVERYADPKSWEEWTQTKGSDLVNEVAGLPSALVDDDVDAKTFDLLVLRAQLALLRADSSFAKLKDRIVELVGLLEGLSNVPMVKGELELILEIQTASYWQDVTVAMLENVRRRLRSLIKLIETKKRTIVYSDFTDEIGVGTPMPVVGIPVGTDMDRFRSKARQFLMANQANLSVAKVRRNESLTKADLDELERLLLEAGVAGSDELDAITSGDGLGLFVRSLIGLDRVAAKAAFSEFLANRALNSNQLEFVNMLIEHLTAQGAVSPLILYESPFTDINPSGVEGVFAENDVGKIIDILARVRKNAAA